MLSCSTTMFVNVMLIITEKQCSLSQLSDLQKTKKQPKDTEAVYGEVVKVRCKPGYWFSRGQFDRQFECDASGQWRGYVQGCKRTLYKYCVTIEHE